MFANNFAELLTSSIFVNKHFVCWKSMTYKFAFNDLGDAPHTPYLRRIIIFEHKLP